MRIDLDATELHRALRDIGERGERTAELTPAISEMLVGAILEVFEVEGPGWEPLAPSTLRRRRGGGAGAKILQDTGVLANSITGTHGPTYAEAGSNVPYGGFHVTGTKRMPKRDWLAVDLPALAEDVAALLLDEVAG